MPDSTAAIWSAIAASFSALSAVMILVFNRRNYIESLRPELVITDWSREEVGPPQSEHEQIHFRSIRNVGRGVAFTIISVNDDPGNKPLVSISPWPIHILAPGEQTNANGCIDIWWKKCKRQYPSQYRDVFITVTIFSWAANGRRYETRYTLMAYKASEIPYVNQGTEAVAPGLFISARRTISRPVWWLKVKARATETFRTPTSLWNKLRRKTEKGERKQEKT